MGLVVGSPPSRGAWIEILLRSVCAAQAGRPLRGGRGLKWLTLITAPTKGASPPSRGAWIEIVSAHWALAEDVVAPFAGGVD